jgi:sRNA-binding protein
MTQIDTALAQALKNAVQSMSKKKQTEMIAEYIYTHYAVFKQFKPLAIGIHETLETVLKQHEPQLIHRVLSNHCRKPRYMKSVANGSKRFSLDNKPVSDLTPEEKLSAQKQLDAIAARLALSEKTAKPQAPEAGAVAVDGAHE